MTLKKILLIAVMALALVPALGLAQAPACSPGYTGTQLCNGIPSLGGRGITDIPSFISAALSWLATVIGTLALVMVIFGGAQMVFSQGDPEAVKRAKGTLAYSVYGLVLVMFAYVIVSGVQYFIGLGDELEPGQTSNQFFVNPLVYDNLTSFIQTTAVGFLGIVGTAAVLYIVLSGFRYITSGGNEEQAKKARAGLTWAVLGLISIILSYVIVTVVVNTVTNSAT